MINDRNLIEWNHIAMGSWYGRIWWFTAPTRKPTGMMKSTLRMSGNSFPLSNQREKGVDERPHEFHSAQNDHPDVNSYNRENSGCSGILISYCFCYCPP
jgi:hypothetical protein